MAVGRQCCLSIASCGCQAVCVAFVVAFSFYFASLALTPVRILGITQLPPGIAYTTHDMRF
tara:strand:- start:124 stop:306 length:183 start_codon:yes stop_codon:yes gene_type:complete